MRKKVCEQNAANESPYRNNFGTSRLDVHRQISSQHAGDKTPNAEMKLMGFLKIERGG